MLETKDVNRDVVLDAVFTVQLRPDTVSLDARIGPDADKGEAFALCTRLLGAIRDFNRAGTQRSEHSFNHTRI